MSDEQPVLVEVSGRIGRLTLNKPKTLHSLTTEMCRIMTDALLKWRDDPKIQAVLIDHLPGSRGFCAGGDIRMLADSGKGDGVEGREFFATEYRLNHVLHGYKKPVVALIDGVTMGGGVGISVHNSHRIATERTTFAMPESGIGLFPDVGGGWFLPRLEGELGMWLALTGARLKGADVLAAGVATHMINGDDAEAFTASLLNADLGSEPHGALDAIIGPFEADPAGPASFDPHRGTIDACFSKDSAEAIIEALLQRGEEWADKQVEIIADKSPTTLKVAHRQLREGAMLTDFADNMKMEYRIGSRILVSHDFLEGVRAVIIDKDNDPAWEPATLEGVTDARLDEIFAPVDDELALLD